jgi:hypothetical protein
MKPLVRWIVGPVFPKGFRCLALSYKKLRGVYGDSLDYLICHNQLNPSQREEVEAIGCPSQDQFPYHFPVPPTYWPSDPGNMDGSRNCWKLHPPRLRQEAHEIILDNDIVIADRLPTIDAFLTSSRPMLAEGLQRNYGQFVGNVPEGVVLNSGIIGLPPGFDFRGRLLNLLPPGWEWGGFFDEQGLVVSSLVGDNPLVVGLDEVAICQPHERPTEAHGHHFVGLNSNPEHFGWEQFRTVRLL